MLEVAQNTSPLIRYEQLRKIDKPSAMSVIQKRAKSKYISLRLMKKMCALNSPLSRGYQKTCSCATVVEQKDGKMTSRYCGHRWCLVCNRIRSAQCINKYEPILKTWNDTQFVTLTVVNVPANDLLKTVIDMNKNFRRILDVMRKNNIPIKGIRKIEITYNSMTNTFHPHFHVLVEGKEAADMLHAKWLKKNPTSKAIAQRVMGVDCDNVNVYKEMFKYMTKLFDKDKQGKYKEVNPIALDIIFRIMKGRRSMQPFGFKAPIIEEEGAMELTESTDALRPGEKTTFVWCETDWFDMETGEALANFRITRKIKRMLAETGLDET